MYKRSKKPTYKTRAGVGLYDYDHSPAYGIPDPAQSPGYIRQLEQVAAYAKGQGDSAVDHIELLAAK